MYETHRLPHTFEKYNMNIFISKRWMAYEDLE